MDPLIEIRDLSVWFKSFQAISHATLEVNEGEIVTLIGPSGCGKSTLLNTIVGIIPHMTEAKLEGEVKVFGMLPKDLSPGTVDVVFQEGCLLPWRTAKQNITLGLEVLKNHSSRITAKEMLTSMDLSEFEESYPNNLSGGMKQRVTLASSLVIHPRLLLLDEPFANLDSITREKMWDIVTTLHLNHLIETAVIVTHMMDEAAVLADRVVVMGTHPGRIIKEINVNLPWPRIREGLLVKETIEIANIIRATIREVNHETA